MQGFEDIRTGCWKLPRGMVCMWHLSAPRSAVFACDSGPSAKAWDGGCRSPVSGWEQRRFDIETARSGDSDGRFWPSRVFSSGGRCRRIRYSRPPCVPHRHIRRAVWGVKRRDRSDTPSLPPCRRRETIFRRPGAWGSASSPHAPRRSRLAATPSSVSVAGWGDCSHRFGGRGKIIWLFNLAAKWSPKSGEVGD